ncbi:MAG: biotin/lipoyl-binding protein [Desulfobacterales bacterium]
MVAGLLITAIAGFLFWLVFFKFKWIRLTYGWGLFIIFFVLHIALIFVVGLRFVTPYTTNAKVIQHTIQLVPRLPEPTLVTAVLVEPDVPVKKGQPLFQFDRRPYEYKVRQLEAQLAQAKQNVRVMKADTEVTAQKVVKLKSELAYSTYQQKLSTGLSRQGAGPEEDAQKWTAKVAADKAAIKEAEAELLRAQLNYESQIDGVNTKVAAIQAELDQARYYLDNTLMVAPEDGRIVNLQVRPGMVSGIIRFGAIASLICDEGRYLLGDFFQEHLKYVKPGQPVEVALDLYPGQIFTAKVEAVWKASGVGQLLPSGTLPGFEPAPPDKPQGQYAVKILFDSAELSKFPIGAQGAAAIYTDGLKGSWAALRRISIRTYTWFSWLYPMPF